MRDGIYRVRTTFRAGLIGMVVIEYGLAELLKKGKYAEVKTKVEWLLEKDRYIHKACFNCMA